MCPMEWNDGERAKLNWSSNYNDQKRHRNQVQLDIIAVSRACENSIILERTLNFSCSLRVIMIQELVDYFIVYTQKFLCAAGCNAMSEFFT